MLGRIRRFLATTAALFGLSSAPRVVTMPEPVPMSKDGAGDWLAPRRVRIRHGQAGAKLARLAREGRLGLLR